MRHFKQLLTTVSTGLLAVSLFSASAAARDAKIIKRVGDGAATVTLPNGSQVAATEGLTVQENSVIETKAGVELYVEATVGVIATIKANSKVKVEAPNAVLNPGFRTAQRLAQGSDNGLPIFLANCRAERQERVG